MTDGTQATCISGQINTFLTTTQKISLQISLSGNGVFTIKNPIFSITQIAPSPAPPP